MKAKAITNQRLIKSHALWAGITALLLGLMLVLANASQAAAATKYASIVIDAKTGEVIHNRHSLAKRYPASLTKMMTLYMTFEALAEGKLSIDQQLTTSRRAAGQPASKLHLRRGQRISVEQAILALVTRSANDVATVLGEAIGGTESRFASLMTERARALGMKDTTFKNASGLPNRHQKTTAYDMALLARALIEHYPDRYHYFSTRAFKFGKRTYKTHNKLLGTYSGTDGIKTGYINASGYNLVSSVKRGPHHLIGVVFGGRSPARRNNHMKALLTDAFKAVRQGKTKPQYVVDFLPRPTPRGGQRIQTAWEYEKARGLAMAAGQWSAKQNTQIAARAVRANTPMPNARPGFAAAPAMPKSRSIAAAIISSPAHAATSSHTENWQVQVGAYYSKEKAHARAKDAQGKLQTLSDGEIVTPALRRGSRTIYRSRIAGLSKPTAYGACKGLSRKGFDCLTIAPKKNRSVAALNR
ncbi:MAG: D-alanyl-D-alanine carboxypeptidase family protein [Alphaproteobacteria bacterium]